MNEINLSTETNCSINSENDEVNTTLSLLEFDACNGSTDFFDSLVQKQLEQRKNESTQMEVNCTVALNQITPISCFSLTNRYYDNESDLNAIALTSQLPTTHSYGSTAFSENTSSVSPNAYLETTSLRKAESLSDATSAKTYSPFSKHNRHVTPTQLCESKSTHESMNSITGRNSIIDLHTSGDMSTMHGALSTGTVSDEIAVTTITADDEKDESTPYSIEYYRSLSFTVVVHRMISEVCAEIDSSIMHWSTCGNYFFIHQKHTMLPSVLKQYFNHGNYQSLRRQLNMYGFGKFKKGENIGYWYHPNFYLNSTYNEILSVKTQKRASTSLIQKAPSRTKNPLVKKSIKRNQMSTQHKEKDKAVDTSKHVVESCTTKGFSPITHIANEVNDDLDKYYPNQRKAVPFEISQYSSGRASFLGPIADDELISRIATTGSIAEIEFLPIQDLFPTDSRRSVSPMIGEVTHDALNALATVASFFPIVSCTPPEKPAKTVTYFESTPIEKKGNFIAGAASPSKAVTLTITKDYANIFIPTPIKVLSTMDWSYDFWSDTLDSCLYDCMSTTYSVSSISSPTALILPNGDRSAFTPVIRSIDQTLSSDHPASPDMKVES